VHSEHGWMATTLEQPHWKDQQASFLNLLLSTTIKLSSWFSPQTTLLHTSHACVCVVVSPRCLHCQKNSSQHPPPSKQTVLGKKPMLSGESMDTCLSDWVCLPQSLKRVGVNVNSAVTSCLRPEKSLPDLGRAGACCAVSVCRE